MSTDEMERNAAEMRQSMPSHMADRRLWEIQPLRDLAALLTIVAFLWLLYDLRHGLAPVLIALVLAYACNPLIQAAGERGPRDAPATRGDDALGRRAQGPRPGRRGRRA